MGEQEAVSEPANKLRHYQRNKDMRRELGHHDSSQRPSGGHTHSPKPLIPTLRLDRESEDMINLRSSDLLQQCGPQIQMNSKET